MLSHAAFWGVGFSTYEVVALAQRAAIGGLLCFVAGCLMIVLPAIRHGTNALTIGFGGLLIALGLFWLGPKGSRREKHKRKD
jgi:hypothetical protein